MANNYSQFSTEIQFETAAQRDWFVERLSFDPADYLPTDEAEAGDLQTHENPLFIEMTEFGVDDDEGFSGIEYERVSATALWCGSEEGGDLGQLAALVALYQREFGIKTVWSAQGCFSCSKLRVDEFGGFACVVHLGKVEWLDTGTWIHERERAIADARA